MVFIVRDDDGHSDLLFQTSDTTWQAYNDYGGNSLYPGSPAGRAYKVSYNRPFVTRGNPFRRASLFGAEYPMIRWLEANGYDMSYSTGVDSDRRGAEIIEHKVFLSVGHDEYWSGQSTRQRGGGSRGWHPSRVFQRRMRFSGRRDGKTAFRRLRTPYRTLVTYKETHANAKIDPTAKSGLARGVTSVSARQPTAGDPENALTGTIFTVNCCATGLPLRISESRRQAAILAEHKRRELGPGQTATVAPGILGYEFDEELNNGSRPPGMMRLSTSTSSNDSYLLRQRLTYGPGTVTHALTLYRHNSGALVFGAGHDPMVLGAGREPRRGFADAWHSAESRANHPTGDGEPARGHGCATADAAARTRWRAASNDNMGPTTVITSPALGASLRAGTAVNITGTASDIDGYVSAIEVSVDGGITWQRANGKASWTYSWTPAQHGMRDHPGSCHRRQWQHRSPRRQRQRYCRTPDMSVHDLGFIRNPGGCLRPEDPGSGTGRQVQVRSRRTHHGIRFYKGAANTGTHIGNLWTATAARCWQGSRSRTKQRRAGSRRTFRVQCRLPRTRPTSPRITQTWAATPRRAVTSDVRH